MNSKAYNDAVLKNIAWFENSGIMSPADGSWGVAERLFITRDAELKQRVLDTFGAFTDKDECCVVESRRPDCNFQTAYLFLLAGKKDIAQNILDFLYFKSGLLNRGNSPEAACGLWNWSHAKWAPYIWLDDNAWCLALPLMIAEISDEFEKRYDIHKWAKLLAYEIFKGFSRVFENRNNPLWADCSDPERLWLGRPAHPHWGSLVCFGLSKALEHGIGKGEFEKLIHEYHEFVSENIDSFNPSELAYAVTGAIPSYKATNDKLCLEVAKAAADKLVSKMDPATGNVPAEHYEAPVGKHLADTIYTINWIAFGFLALAETDEKYRAPFEKIIDLLVSIQDKSDSKLFNGCWRGMFDLNSGKWGGGDSYEGGAGSIYSGWTNAPIAITLAKLIDKQ